VIAAGFAYQKLVDLLGDTVPSALRVLRLGTFQPLPEQSITACLETAESALVLEETAPLIERAVRAAAQRARLTLPVYGAPFAPHPPAGRTLPAGRRQDIGRGQSHDFAHPQASPQHQGQDGPVAGRLDDVPQAAYRLHRHISRQTVSHLGSMAGEANRVGLVQATSLLSTEVEESLVESSHPASDGSRLPARLPALVNERVDVGAGDLGPGLGTGGQKETNIADIVGGCATPRRASLERALKTHQCFLIVRDWASLSGLLVVPLL